MTIGYKTAGIQSKMLVKVVIYFMHLDHNLCFPTVGDGLVIVAVKFLSFWKFVSDKCFEVVG